MRMMKRMKTEKYFKSTLKHNKTHWLAFKGRLKNVEGAVDFNGITLHAPLTHRKVEAFSPRIRVQKPGKIYFVRSKCS